MGRPNKGLRVEWRRGIGHARFTHAGEDRLISTGKRDSDAAQAEAERIYRRETGTVGPRPLSARELRASPLDMLCAEWLSSLVGTLDPKTIETYTKTYCRKHWLGFFRSLDEMRSPLARERYRTARLAKALAKTVKKECWAQDKFLRWCVTAEVLHATELPPALVWLKTTMGTRTGRQREQPRELAPADVGAFLAALPEWIERGPRARTKPPIVVRDRMVFAYETALRPETLREIVWGDVLGARGALRVRPEVDKTRFGRDVPLSLPAQACLERVRAGRVQRGLPVGPLDPVFGRHKLPKTIARAAKAAGLDGVAPYDLRHSRSTHLADAGAAITGIGYLVGHKQATTTNKYLHQSERAAIKALAATNPVRPTNPSEETGWPTGFEPATSGATILASSDDKACFAGDGLFHTGTLTAEVGQKTAETAGVPDSTSESGHRTGDRARSTEANPPGASLYVNRDALADRPQGGPSPAGALSEPAALWCARCASQDVGRGPAGTGSVNLGPLPRPGSRRDAAISWLGSAGPYVAALLGGAR